MTDIDTNSDAERDLRVLFRRTAPAATPVDLDALRAAAHTTGIRPVVSDPVPPTMRISLPTGSASGLAMRRMIAAAVTLLVAVGGVAVWFLPGEAGANAVFAAVQERMAETQTVTFKETERRPGQPAEVTRISIRGANLMRADLPDGNYSVMDLAAKRSLSVDREKRKVTLIEGFGPLARIEEPINLYEQIRNIRQDAVKPLPDRTIDRRWAAGFQVSIEVAGHKQELQVWVDPETKLPVRFEQTLGKIERISSDFRFDVELDESLFAFEPPEGYELETLGVAKLKDPPDDESVAAPAMTPLVGIGPAKFGMSKEEIIRLLGEPDRIHTLEAGYGTDMLEYYSRGFGLHVSRRAGFVYGYAASGKTFAVQMRPFAGRTDKGIRLGASEADIRRAYGEPSSVEEPTLNDVFGDEVEEPDRKTGQKTLNYDDLRTWFSLQGGKLDQITILADVRKLLKDKGLLDEE